MFACGTAAQGCAGGGQDAGGSGACISCCRALGKRGQIQHFEARSVCWVVKASSLGLIG